MSHTGEAAFQRLLHSSATLHIVVTQQDGRNRLEGVTLTIEGHSVSYRTSDNPHKARIVVPTMTYRITAEKEGWYLQDAGRHAITDERSIEVEAPSADHEARFTLRMAPKGVVRAQWNPAEVLPDHHVAPDENITHFVQHNSVGAMLGRHAPGTETTVEVDTDHVPNGTGVQIELFHGTRLHPTPMAPVPGGVINNLEVQNNVVVVQGTVNRPTFRFTDTDAHDLWGKPDASAGADVDAHQPFYYFKATLLGGGGPFAQPEGWSTRLRLLYLHIGLGDAVADMDGGGGLGSVEVARAYALYGTSANVGVGKAGWFNQSDPDRRLWGHALRNTYSYCHLMHGWYLKPPSGILNRGCFAIGGHRQIGTSTDEYRCPQHHDIVAREQRDCPTALFGCEDHPAPVRQHAGPCPAGGCGNNLKRRWRCSAHHGQVAFARGANCGVCGQPLELHTCGQQLQPQPRDTYTCPTHPEIIRSRSGRCTVCNTLLVGPNPAPAAAAETYTLIFPQHVSDAAITPVVPKYLVVMFSCSAGKEESLVDAFKDRGTWYVGAFGVTIYADDAKDMMQNFFIRWKNRYHYNPYKIAECWEGAFIGGLRERMQPWLFAKSGLPRPASQGVAATLAKSFTNVKAKLVGE